MISKKIIKISIILLIVFIIIGIAYYFIKNNKDAIPVYSVQELSMENYWQNNSTSEGTVKEDKIQSVYVSSTLQVEKIAVTEGKSVKKGDVLLKYNTTLTDIELEKKQIDIRKLEHDLEKANNELAKIKTYQPNVPISGNLPDVTQTDTTQSIHTELPNLTAPQPEVEATKEINPAPLTGNGSVDTPYLFIWNENKEYDKSFIESLINRVGNTNTEVTAIFMIREGNSLTGNLIKATKIKFTKTGTDYNFSILSIPSDFDPLYPNGTVENNNPETEISDTSIPEVGESYTASELQKMILEKEKEINDATLNIKKAKNEYTKLKSELENTTIYSNIDGTVKTVLSVDDENLSTKPIIVVSGGGGYLVEGKLNEFDLAKTKVGQKVTVQSYESGINTEGTIESISTYPAQNSYVSTVNSNVSYYPYTVSIGEDVSLKSGENVSLSIVSEEGESNSFYLNPAFVISENGKNYAYVAGEDGKLERREVITGKNMMGMIEIYSGITENDMIAFPYGKDVKEGIATEEASTQDLDFRNIELEVN